MIAGALRTLRRVLLISLFTERISRPLFDMIATLYWPQRLAYSGHWHSL
jgi:hypothetical protein